MLQPFSSCSDRRDQAHLAGGRRETVLSVFLIISERLRTGETQEMIHLLSPRSVKSHLARFFVVEPISRASIPDAACLSSPPAVRQKWRSVGYPLHFLSALL